VCNGYLQLSKSFILVLEGNQQINSANRNSHMYRWMALRDQSVLFTNLCRRNRHEMNADVLESTPATKNSRPLKGLRRCVSPLGDTAKKLLFSRNRVARRPETQGELVAWSATNNSVPDGGPWLHRVQCHSNWRRKVAPGKSGCGRRVWESRFYRDFVKPRLDSLLPTPRTVPIKTLDFTLSCRKCRANVRPTDVEIRNTLGEFLTRNFDRRNIESRNLI